MLALERTRLANERTFLAYVRTALALVAAGAAVLEFFPETATLRLLAGSLIVCGVLALSLGLVRFFHVRLELNRRAR